MTGSSRSIRVVAEHIDACLGCMACVTACPSGVRYDILIEATRARIEEESAADARRPCLSRVRLRAVSVSWPVARARAVSLAGPDPRLAAFGRRPARSRAAASAASARHDGAADRAAPIPSRRFRAKTPARGTSRARVALVAGCVQRTFFPGVNAATIRVLSAEGCDVSVPPAKAAAARFRCTVDGSRKRSASRARSSAGSSAEDYDAVLINAAGCGFDASKNTVIS